MAQDQLVAVLRADISELKKDVAAANAALQQIGKNANLDGSTANSLNSIVQLLTEIRDAGSKASKPVKDMGDEMKKASVKVDDLGYTFRQTTVVMDGMKEVVGTTRKGIDELGNSISVMTGKDNDVKKISITTRDYNKMLISAIKEQKSNYAALSSSKKEAAK